MSDHRQRLFELWRQLLEDQEADAGLDFVSAGGTSLSAVELAAAIQDELGLEVDAIDVVEAGSFAEFAAKVDNGMRD